VYCTISYMTSIYCISCAFLVFMHRILLFYAYISCIVAYHLGTLDARREGEYVVLEPTERWCNGDQVQEIKDDGGSFTEVGIY
jgi:hypothetical protein